MFVSQFLTTVHVAVCKNLVNEWTLLFFMYLHNSSWWINQLLNVSTNLQFFIYLVFPIGSLIHCIKSNNCNRYGSLSIPQQIWSSKYLSELLSVANVKAFNSANKIYRYINIIARTYHARLLYNKSTEVTIYNKLNVMNTVNDIYSGLIETKKWKSSRRLINKTLMTQLSHKDKLLVPSP